MSVKRVLTSRENKHDVNILRSYTDKYICVLYMFTPRTTPECRSFLNNLTTRLVILFVTTHLTDPKI